MKALPLGSQGCWRGSRPLLSGPPLPEAWPLFLGCFLFRKASRPSLISEELTTALAFSSQHPWGQTDFLDYRLGSMIPLCILPLRHPTAPLRIDLPPLLRVRSSLQM